MYQYYRRNQRLALLWASLLIGQLIEHLWLQSYYAPGVASIVVIKVIMPTLIIFWLVLFVYYTNAAWENFRVPWRARRVTDWMYDELLDS